MTAVYYQRSRHRGFFQQLYGIPNRFLVIIGMITTAAQHHMHIRIPRRADNAGHAIIIYPQKSMRSVTGRHRVNGRLQTSVCSIFQTDRHGQTAGHFPMRLAFRRAGSDRSPADQIIQVLRNDRIQELCRRGQSHPNDLQQQTPGDLQTGFDIIGTVHERIIDQSLPSDRSTGLLKINPHH